MKFYKLLYVLLFPVFGCMTGVSSGVEKNIAKNLTYILNPGGEDVEDIYTARKICKCVARQVATSWPEDEMREFDAELTTYAANVDKSLSVESVEDLMAGRALRQRPEKLNAFLDKIVPYVEQCESKIGGRGVEF